MMVQRTDSTRRIKSVTASATESQERKGRKRGLTSDVVGVHVCVEAVHQLQSELTEESEISVNLVTVCGWCRPC